MKFYRGLGLQRYIEEDIKACNEVASSVATKIIEDVKKDDKEQQKKKRGRKKKEDME